MGSGQGRLSVKRGQFTGATEEGLARPELPSGHLATVWVVGWRGSREGPGTLTWPLGSVGLDFGFCLRAQRGSETCPGSHSIWAGLGRLRHSLLGHFRAICCGLAGTPPPAGAGSASASTSPAWVTPTCMVGLGGEAGRCPCAGRRLRGAASSCPPVTDAAWGLGFTCSWNWCL